jgi:KaiC/GvpD/RAD55 family RecA-like ATPase
MTNEYIRVTKGLADKGVLVSPSELHNIVTDTEKDYYASLYYYTPKHYELFKKNGSIRGITDVYTDSIVFDFDSKTDLDQTKLDALTAIERLKKFGVKESDVELYFSGNKGFTINVRLNRKITPEEARKIALDKIAGDLKTTDSSVYDASQIIRVPGTKHPKSGLYKVPLKISQLKKLSIDEIREYASSLDHVTEEFEWTVAEPKTDFFTVEKKIVERPKMNVELDLSKKPTQWKNCKWSLLQGNFDEGQRHNALMVIAATCRGLGYDKETTYYMCKSSLKKQSALRGQDEFPKEELWKNIIEQSVFTDNWEGGQYTCSKDGWLKDYCDRLGQHKCQDKDEDEPPCVRLEDITAEFNDYAKNFEQNVIKTGIKPLDENVTLCTSTLAGLLGQPGAGKTSMAINYLRNTSAADIPSVFLSLDMGKPIVYAKLVQKITGHSFKAVLDLFKNDPREAARIAELLKDEYKNVGFNFKSGVTVPDIRTIVQEHEQTLGKKVKLLVIDYLECLSGPYADQTANTGFLANQLKDLSNDLGVCTLLLLQTQKHSTPDISDPLLSLKGVKGSSLIEQSCSTILTLWRDGYNPKHVQDDKYISFAVVKNRFGSLWSGDFSWNGLRGDIRELSEEEEDSLAEFRERKRQEKAAAASSSKDDWS